MSESKKSQYIIYVIVGILLQTLILDFKIGPLLICPINLIGVVASIIGILPFSKEQNRLFKMCLPTLYIAIILHIGFMFVSLNMDASHRGTLILVFHSMLAIILMNFTYKYTEALTWQAKFLKKEADMPLLRSAYLTYCVFIALTILADNYDVLIVTLVARFISYAAAVYYANSLNQLRKKIYVLIKKTR